MTDPEKAKRLEKFKAMQDDLKGTLRKVPPGCKDWFYQKAYEFKKVVKDCDKFIKLRPTDDGAKLMKLENQLQKLKRYY